MSLCDLTTRSVVFLLVTFVWEITANCHSWKYGVALKYSDHFDFHTRANMAVYMCHVWSRYTKVTYPHQQWQSGTVALETAILPYKGHLSTPAQQSGTIAMPYLLLGWRNIWKSQRTVKIAYSKALHIFKSSQMKGKWQARSPDKGHTMHLIAFFDQHLEVTSSSCTAHSVSIDQRNVHSLSAQVHLPAKNHYSSTLLLATSSPMHPARGDARPTSKASQFTTSAKASQPSLANKFKLGVDHGSWNAGKTGESLSLKGSHWLAAALAGIVMGYHVYLPSETDVWWGTRWVFVCVPIHGYW